MTHWSAQVNPTNALPDYPRPQLVRPDWLNLNGLWDYAISPDTSAVTVPRFQGKILVPFPVEAALSGVMTNLDEHSKLWYHCTFTVPPAWRGRHARLHFGGVDWSCQVWLNGRDLGRHQGGYDAFSFDLTGALHWNEPEDLSICVTDPTEGDQPRGKQSRKPEGIFYTPSSGIWQTVWLEPVPEICIERLQATPDLDAKTLRVSVSVNRLAQNLVVEALASAGGKEIAHVTGPANATLALNIPDPHPWSPDDPFLYDLNITLKNGDQLVDSISSYFGLRKIGLRKDDQGLLRITLNDKFIFQVGTLDQGFWPDGLYTAPTDEALRSDIEFLRRTGFNLTRKHVKVEPDRWYYWCDKLGMLVWQDMPSGNNATVDGRRDFENELLHMVAGLYNHPCIVTWVLFNESWGQYDTESLSKWLKNLDPSRLVDNASGWTDMRTGDLIDMHNYPGPGSPAPEPYRAAVLGEFGGLGLSFSNHSWSTRYWSYVTVPDTNELAARYVQAINKVWQLHNLRGLSAVVYTQTSDVETECNGLLTYDRAVAKIEPALLLAANRGSLAETPAKVLLPDAIFGRAEWKYTFEKPADEWIKPAFDASGWKQGISGFGTGGTPGIFVNTTWDTADIWLRKIFPLNPQDLPSTATADRSSSGSSTLSEGLKLQVFHDEDAEIYLNGVLALKLSGYITDYEEFDISKEAAAALHPGDNTIAVHCHQTTGGQGIDVGLIVPSSSKSSPGN
jgi:hypothetical protein